MDDKIVIDVARLDPEGETLSGEADIVKLDEEFVKSKGPAKYSLHARMFGDELLVKGRLEQAWTMVCSRCARDFESVTVVEDYVFSAEIGKKEQFFDLTNDARECIILDLPNFPLCDGECPGIAGKSESRPDERWNALDAMKLD